MRNARPVHTIGQKGGIAVSKNNQPELTGVFSQDAALLDRALRVEANFDVIGRNLLIGGRQGRLYFIDGFAKDEVMEKVLEFLLTADPAAVADQKSATAFINRFIPYVECDSVGEPEKIVASVLSGTLALVVEGYTHAVMIDARTYPARSIQEPEDDRVLRGAHHGFVETLILNTALIRRYIRSPQLTMDITQIGKDSKTDVVLCYLADQVDRKLLRSVKEKLAAIDVSALTMSQESLAECLLKPQWYNPFPRVRYTERPDAAAATVLEGNLLIITDNSPSVIILPASLLDFVQDTNDFYFPPLVGSYLRLVRILIFVATLLITPVWLLLVSHPDWLPPWLAFLRVEEPGSLPIVAQLILIELIIDALKLASLNTPSVLSNSFSVVGALILGDFAVKAGWFIPEVVLYMAFVAIANFTQSSFELGYALKLCRMLLIILTACLGVWGLIGGLLLILLCIATTRTPSGRSYLYPLIPFNANALKHLLLRPRLHQQP